MATQYVHVVTTLDELKADLPNASTIGFFDDQLVVKGSTSTGSFGHFKIRSSADNRQVRINSRNFTQTSGDSIGFQCKPSQTVNGGSIQGGQISPRCQDGVTLSGSIIGLHVDTDLKGTSAGTISGDVRVLELEIVGDVGGTRTITGDVCAIRVRSFMPATGGASTVSVFKIETTEPGGLAYDSVFDFVGTQSLAWHDTDSDSGDTEAGYFAVTINGNKRYVVCYSNAPTT